MPGYYYSPFDSPRAIRLSEHGDRRQVAVALTGRRTGSPSETTGGGLPWVAQGMTALAIYPSSTTLDNISVPSRMA